MKTFFNILQSLVNIKNKSFPTNKLTSLTNDQQQYIQTDYDSELKIYIKLLLTADKPKRTQKWEPHHGGTESPEF